MQYIKTRNVKSPNRANVHDAGIDFYIPEDIGWESTTLLPNESILIDSGIKMTIPKGFALIAFNKSGVATKQGLTVGACVVDSGYQGNIHIHLINTSNKPQTIKAGQKAVQFVALPVLLINPIEHIGNQLSLFDEESTRGDGGFGSTGH